MTFNEWRATAREVDDIGRETGNSLDDGLPGILYYDAEGYPIGQIERVSDGYRVIAEASELTTDSRDAAERWLWDHWCKYQLV